MPKEKVIQEYVVEGRDDYGHPIVIARAPAVESSALKKFDDKKLSRKRLLERESLKSKNQNNLEEIFWLPAQLEKVQQAKREHEETPQAQPQVSVDTATLDQNDKMITPSEVRKSSISQPSPQYVTVQQPNGLQLLHLYILLTSVFFLMALSPAFRKWMVEEIIVKLFIESISPPFLHIACRLGEYSVDHFPVCANIMISLYNLFGFWVIAAGVLWLGYNFSNMLKFIATTAWMEACPRPNLAT